MKPFTTVAAAVFAFVAALHITRIALGWKVIVGAEVMALGGTPIPMWVSYLGLAVSAGLAVMLWRESR